ncbi:DNA repair protein XRCC2 [Lingula anatina]|uniref:DNA repair protein XRCC2 n=1 Tax=Lingula anatina TaxID=7574 RepID=A0A1S3JBQ3_LINAN|nr:DNA repair protein XRCC2 [Lingula anatina]|eukprot:XP_013407314.1 DNA repair protein XRCC2 [Lingula anatina]
MATPRCESGAQLLARLGTKPDLMYVEPHLLPSGPQKRDVIELYGDEGCGKTEMLLHIILNTILPRNWRGFSFYGQEAGIILIDTDYHFSILRLSTLLENRVDRVVSEATGLQKNGDLIPQNGGITSNTGYKDLPEQENPKLPTQTDKETFIKSCLKRLFVFRCSSPTQLIATLHSLDALLLNRPEICILMLDSLSAFYWIDHSNGCDSAVARESNQRQVCKILNKLITSYNLVIFATKPAIIHKRNNLALDKTEEKDCTGNPSIQTGDKSSDHCEYLCKAWQKMVSSRWSFSKGQGNKVKQSVNAQMFILKLFNLTSSFLCQEKFIVSENGIEYI